MPPAPRTPLPRRSSLAPLALLSLLAAAPAAAGTSRVAWSELELRASKLFFSATSEVELEALPAAQAGRELLPLGVGDGLAPAGEETLRLTLRSRGPGRRSELRLWLEPDAIALQRTSLETRKRKSFSGYRFTPAGVHRQRREPNDGEEDLAPERWTGVTETFYPYPPQAGRAPRVVEPSALLYLISASGLARPGDRLEILAFVRRRLQRVEIAVQGRERLTVDYREVSAAGERRVEGSVEALRLSVAGEPVEVSDEDGDEFRFLGLRGEISIDLDPATRVPLRITGKVPVAGRVQVRLKRAVLR